MKTTLKTIVELKSLLIKETDLSRICHCFFDLAEDKRFMEMSVPIKVLEEYEDLGILLQSVKKVVNDNLGINLCELFPLFHRIAQDHFFHGCCGVIEPRQMLLPLFYFSDIQKGLFAWPGFSGETQFFRLSLAQSYGRSQSQFEYH